MQWILISCFLLASAHDISTARPKRDLWPTKSLISSKLFGTETVVLELPKIPKNERYQLFRIKGYDNVYLKVTRKDKEKEVNKPLKIQFEDHVMPSPEMAIIGNYLGTATQQETVLALEIVKNLLKSGILKSEREKLVQEVVVPMPLPHSEKGYFIHESIKPVNVITEQRDPIYVDTTVTAAKRINVVNHPPLTVYPANHPPIVVASEVKYSPLQTKYSYKQETDHADMTYESYNNRGVIVTKTNKVPVKPQYVTMRLANVFTLAANPHLIRSQPPATSTIMNAHLIRSQPPTMSITNPQFIRSQQPTTSTLMNPQLTSSVEIRPAKNTVISEKHVKESLSVVPVHSYVMEKKSQTTLSPAVVKESEYVDSNNLNDYTSSFVVDPPKVSESLEVPSFVKHSKTPFDIRDHLTDGEIDKLNTFINMKLDVSRNNDNVLTTRPYSDEHDFDGDENNEEAAGDGQISPGQIVSRYSYKQMGDEEYRNYTVVRIEDPKLNQSGFNVTKPGDKSLQDYIYIPPNIDVPIPMTNTNNMYPPPLPNANSINDNKYDEYDVFNSNVENYSKTSAPISLRGDIEQLEEAEKPGTLKTNDHSLKIPIIVPEIDLNQNSGRPYTGGQGAIKPSKTSNEKLYIGGSGVRNR